MFATNELVAMGWLRGLNLDISGVNTSLPTDTSTWGTKPFVVVESVVGGQFNPHTTQRQPVVGIGVYAVSLTSGGVNPKPPLKQAVETAEAIVRETIKFSFSHNETPVILPTGYEPAWIQEIYPVSEVTRRPGDQGSLAVYDLNIQFYWSSAVPTA